MNLGAYYRYDMEKEPPMPGELGAYYRYDMETEPPMPGTLNGLAEDSALKLLRHTRPMFAGAIWARRTGELTWQTTPRRTELVFYPMSDGITAQAEQDSFGGELETLGVLTTAPVSVEAAERTFEGSRYVFERLDAVFSLRDTRPTPRMAFLVTARRRDIADAGGGPNSLDAVARSLGGHLVFVEKTGRFAPRLLPDPESAFQSQFSLVKRRVAPRVVAYQAVGENPAVDALKTLSIIAVVIFVGVFVHGEMEGKKT